MSVANDRLPETIVLQSEPDSMTPYEMGWAAGTGLPNASPIVVDNESIHGVFPYGTDEVDRPVMANSGAEGLCLRASSTNGCVYAGRHLPTRNSLDCVATTWCLLMCSGRQPARPGLKG